MASGSRSVPAIDNQDIDKFRKAYDMLVRRDSAQEAIIRALSNVCIESRDYTQFEVMKKMAYEKLDEKVARIREIHEKELEKAKRAYDGEVDRLTRKMKELEASCRNLKQQASEAISVPNDQALQTVRFQQEIIKALVNHINQTQTQGGSAQPFCQGDPPLPVGFDRPQSRGPGPVGTFAGAYSGPVMSTSPGLGIGMGAGHPQPAGYPPAQQMQNQNPQQFRQTGFVPQPNMQPNFPMYQHQQQQNPMGWLGDMMAGWNPQLQQTMNYVMSNVGIGNIPPLFPPAGHNFPGPSGPSGPQNPYGYHGYAPGPDYRATDAPWQNSSGHSGGFSSRNRRRSGGRGHGGGGFPPKGNKRSHSTSNRDDRSSKDRYRRDRPAPEWRREHPPAWINDSDADDGDKTVSAGDAAIGGPEKSTWGDSHRGSGDDPSYTTW